MEYYPKKCGDNKLKWKNYSVRRFALQRRRSQAGLREKTCEKRILEHQEGVIKIFIILCDQKDVFISS